MGQLLYKVGHGLVASDRIMLGNLVGGEGLKQNTPYYVLAAGLTPDYFKVSLTDGGAPIDFTTNVTDGVIVRTDTYSPVSDGVMDPPAPVGAVTNVAASSETVEDADGSTMVRLIITFTPPTENKLRTCFVQVSFIDDGDPVNPQPVWDANAAIYVVPAGTGTLAVDSVAGNTKYYVRAWAADVYGQLSAVTGYVSTTSVKDTAAPSVPAGLAVTGTMKGMFTKWSASTAKDLSFYELRYAIDIGTGLGPNTNEWTLIRLKTTSAYIGGLLAERNPVTGIGSSRYWVQVRAIDSSGNVDDGTGVALGYLSFPEAGWCAAVSGDTTLSGGGDIDFGALTDNHIVANGLSAGIIKTGDLRINTSDASMVDGIKVYDGAALVGLWNETGLYVYDNVDSSDYVRLYDGGVSVFQNGVEVAAITPDGVNASALTFGKLPGGHNLILNSSFELADFGSAPTVVSWTVSADWTGTAVSTANLTTGADSLTAASLAF